MYQLSINHQGRSVTTTDHPDHDDAHRSLISYVIAADYYLRPLSTDTDTVRYELLALADPDRRAARPQHTGHATISAVTSPATTAAADVDYAARQAHEWISHHEATWKFGTAGSRGSRYPLAVLNTAQAEAQYLLGAGTLWPEAAQMATSNVVAAPGRDQLESLRWHAVEHTGAHRSPSALSAAVQAGLPEHLDTHQTMTLTWWYALLSWGVTAS